VILTTHLELFYLLISSIDLRKLIFDGGFKSLIECFKRGNLFTFILMREVYLRLELIYLGEEITDLYLFGVDDALTHFQLFCLGGHRELLSLYKIFFLK
jgi:hypothetical protein